MSSPLKWAWSVLAILCTLLILGTTALHIASRTVRARIDLKPGAQVSIPVFRFVPDSPRLSMEFDVPAQASPSTGFARRRPELGEWKPSQREETLYFANPGEAVKLRVADRTRPQIYEALPAGGWSRDRIHRSLTPFLDDGDPTRFRWPPRLPSRSIPAGRSTLDISVLEVGDAIQGERVTVVVEPPLTFKRGTGGPMDWLWYFYFWPFYAVILGIAGVVLAYITRKELRRRR